MAFDGIITKSVVSELNNILIAIIFWAKPKNFGNALKMIAIFLCHKLKCHRVVTSIY